MKKIIFLFLFSLIFISCKGEVKNTNVNNSKEIKNYIQRDFAQISVDDFKKEINNPDIILLDVRTPKELSVYGKIRENQLFIDINSKNFTDEISKLDKNKKYLIYCWHGNRSQVARNFMQEQGFIYAKDLEGGIDEWVKRGESVIK